MDVPKFASDELHLNELVKQYIHDHLDCQCVPVDGRREAYQLEQVARKGDIFGDRPLLNPVSAAWSGINTNQSCSPARWYERRAFSGEHTVGSVGWANNPETTGGQKRGLDFSLLRNMGS